MKHIKVTVRGRVQGVWFRASTRDEAVRLGVCGFVRNEPDGDVYLEAEAEQESLNSLIDWLNHGPPLARVGGLDITEAEVKHLTGFTIQR